MISVIICEITCSGLIYDYVSFNHSWIFSEKYIMGISEHCDVFTKDFFAHTLRNLPVMNEWVINDAKFSCSSIA